MPQIGLGIYIKANRLCMVAVRGNFRRSESAMEKIVPLQTENLDSPESIEFAAHSIRAFCRENKIKPSYVTLSLNRADYLWSVVNVPPVSKNDLLKLMQYELELHIPIDPNSVNFDVLPLEQNVGTTSKALLVTSPVSLIDRYTELTQRAGVKLFRIEPMTFSRWRYLFKSGRNSEETAIRIFVIGGSSREQPSIEILIVKNQIPILCRQLTGDDPWGTQQTALEETNPAGLSIAKRLLNDIRLNLMSIGMEGTPEDIPEITFVGHFPQDFPDEVAQLCPDTRIETLSSDELRHSGDFSDIESVAMGAALAHADEQNSINLLPAELRPVQRHIGMALIGVGAGMLLSAAVVIGANNFWKTQLKLMETNARIASMDSRVNQIMEINQKYQTVRDEFDFFRNISQEYPSQLLVLKALTELLPSEDPEDSETSQKVYLDEYYFRDNAVTIRGHSPSPEGLITLLEESPYFEKVHFDGTVSGEKFRIKASLSKMQVEEETPDKETPPGKNEQQNQDPGTPAAKPTPDEKQGTPDDSAASAAQPEENFEEVSRGPAFPRRKAEPTKPATESIPTAVETPNTQEQSTKDEAVEEMKNKLLDFIKQHKDEGDLGGQDQESMEDVAPDEAAENFLEFLRNAAESQSEQDDSEPDSGGGE